jgi:hypothetical protein
MYTKRHHAQELPSLDFDPSMAVMPPETDLPMPPVVKRAHPTRAALTLTTVAHTWLQMMPPRYQPLATAREFPHIVNRLASLWDRQVELPGYFDELLLSSRQARSGFPFDVLTELSDLRLLVIEEMRPRRVVRR